MNKKLLIGAFVAVLLVVGGMVLFGNNQASTSTGQQAQPEMTTPVERAQDLTQVQEPTPANNQPQVQGAAQGNLVEDRSGEGGPFATSTDRRRGASKPEDDNIRNDDRSGGGRFSTPTDRRRGADKPED